MASVVVETDVVSFLFKHDTHAESYRPHLTGKRLVLSFMTIAELDRWVLERNRGQTRRARMEEYLRNFIVYPLDRALCLKWAGVSDCAHRNGRPIQCADAWIAATAVLHSIPLVTHNSKDYVGVDGLTVISEVRP
jgi:tRNA(fMet)-specific endonuclease VapC